MRTIARILLLLCLSASAAAAAVLQPASAPRYWGAQPGEWTMDYDAARAVAASNGLSTIVYFGGTWWCPACQELEKYVLTNQVWTDYASSNRLMLVLLDFNKRNTSDTGTNNSKNACWLWDTNFLAANGLTASDGVARLDYNYTLQSAYAMQGSPRVNYPTWVVLRPDGSRRGRCVVDGDMVPPTITVNTAIRRLEQALHSDAGDEMDDQWNLSPDPLVLNTNACADAEWVEASLSENDNVDWYAVDTLSGSLITLNLAATTSSPPAIITLSIFVDGTNLVEEQTGVLSNGLSVSCTQMSPFSHYYVRVQGTNATSYVQVPSYTNLVPYQLSGTRSVPTATVTFTSTNVSVRDDAGSATLTVLLNRNGQNGSVSVDYYTEDGASGIGIATPGQDYLPVSGTLVWTNGDSIAKTIVVPVLNEVGWVGDKFFTVALESESACNVPTIAARAKVTVRETTIPLPGTVSFTASGAEKTLLTGTAPSVAVNEGGAVVLWLSRTNGHDGAVTVHVKTVDGSAHSNEAYSAFQGDVSWTNGETADKAVTLATIYRPLYQPDGVFTAQVTAVAGGVALGCSRVSVVVRDSVVTLPLPDYVKTNPVVPFVATAGVWFRSTSEDSGGIQDAIRSGCPLPGQAAALAASLPGAGLLAFDLKIGAAAGDSQSVLRITVGAATIANWTSTGADYTNVTLALPSGGQTVRWSFARNRSAVGEAFVAIRNIRWLPLPRAATPFPDNGACVRRSDLTELSWADVLSSWPSGVPRAMYRIVAGRTAGAAKPVAQQLASSLAVDGALAALLNTAGTPTTHWQVNTVVTDGFGREALANGPDWALTAVADDAPAFAPLSGFPAAPWFREVLADGALSVGLTVGVRAEIGPLACSDETGGVLSAGIVAGGGVLPAGMQLEVRAGTNVWLTGVPTRPGSGQAQVQITARARRNGKVQSSPGTSLTIAYTVAPLPAWAQGTFNGYAVDATYGTGVASLTIDATGTVAGRLNLSGRSFLFAATGFAASSLPAEEDLRIETTFLDGTNRVPLLLPVTPLGITNGRIGAVNPEIRPQAPGASEVVAFRNAWQDNGMPAVLANYLGYYTVALPVSVDSGNEQPVGSNDGPLGSGYLTITVGTTGSAKVAGKLGDGTPVSLSTAMLRNSDGRIFTVIYTAPTSYQGGSLFGLVEFATNPVAGGPWVVQPLDGVALEWTSRNPASTANYAQGGFRREVDAVGGYYSPTIDLFTYYAPLPADFSVGGIADVPDLPVVMNGVTTNVTATYWQPEGLALIVTTNRLGQGDGLVAPAADAPVRLPDGSYLYGDSNQDGIANPTGLTLSRVRATGLFHGDFEVYYDFASGAARHHVAHLVSYEGVFTPARASFLTDDVDGHGFFLWPDTAAFATRRGTYSFNWSYDFTIIGPCGGCTDP